MSGYVHQFISIKENRSGITDININTLSDKTDFRIQNEFYSNVIKGFTGISESRNLLNDNNMLGRYYW